MSNKFDRLFKAQEIFDKRLQEALSEKDVSIDKKLEQLRTLQGRLEKVNYSSGESTSKFNLKYIGRKLIPT